MEITFNKVRNCILENGNSNFSNIDNSFSTKLKLQTKNTMLLLEEKNNNSKITMSFLSDSTYESQFHAINLYKFEENSKYILTGESLNKYDKIKETEIKEIAETLKIFENEIKNHISTDMKPLTGECLIPPF